MGMSSAIVASYMESSSRSLNGLRNFEESQKTKLLIQKR